MKNSILGLVLSLFIFLSVVPSSSAGPLFVDVSDDLVVEFNSVIVLNANATSRLDVAYQWYSQGAPLDWETNSALLAFSGEQPENRFYYVVASDAEGSVTSRTINVSIIAPTNSGTLRIVQQPHSYRLGPGAAGFLSVLAESDKPISYQWFRDGVEILGATNAGFEYTIAVPTNGSYQTRYQVRVSDAEASIMSVISVITTLVPPEIYEQTRMQYAIVGDTIRLSVAASGTPQLFYRWRHNGQTLNVPKLDPTWIITNAQVSHSGRYDVVVSNIAWSGILSRPIHVNVCNDDNQNQLPDCWESVYNFQVGQTGRNDDPDNDGLSNYEEYIAGTNPLSSQSVLRFSSVELVSTNIAQLQFVAASNTTYTVQMQPAWYAPKWLRLQDVPTSSADREVEILHTNLYAEAIFYRLITPKVGF